MTEAPLLDSLQFPVWILQYCKNMVFVWCIFFYFDVNDSFIGFHGNRTRYSKIEFVLPGASILGWGFKKSTNHEFSLGHGFPQRVKIGLQMKHIFVTYRNNTPTISSGSKLFSSFFVCSTYGLEIIRCQYQINWYIAFLYVFAYLSFLNIIYPFS